MRGAKQQENGNLKFFSFKGGRFAERVGENTPGATPRKLEKGPNEGKMVYELIYDTVEGAIVNIEVMERGDYGKRLYITMDVSTEEDPDSIIKIELPFSSSAAKGFLKRLPNIDLSQDVALKGYAIEDKEKGRTNYYLIPYQDGKIEPAFTKENPNGLPDMQKIKVKGKAVWDDTEQLEYFEVMIKSIFDSPKVQDTDIQEEPEDDSDEVAF